MLIAHRRWASEHEIPKQASKQASRQKRVIADLSGCWGWEEEEYCRFKRRPVAWVEGADLSGGKRRGERLQI